MIDVNDHYEVTDANSLVQVMNEFWNSSFSLADRTESTIEKILQK